MKKTVLFSLGIFLVLSAAVFPAGFLSAAGISETEYSKGQIYLWSKSAPGSENINMKEEIIERSKTPGVYDRAIIKITQPSIIPMLPPKDKANGSAVLICPGGAYQRVVLDKEGVDIAEWFNSIGVAAFILKYRLPGEGHAQQYNVPLQDAQRAMRLIRKNAGKWNIDPNRIGVAGFSAGGHVASALSTKYAAKVYKPSDEADSVSARPDFTILGYPVVSMKTGITHNVSREMLLGKNPSPDAINGFSNEMNVDADTPAAFVFFAEDDSSVSNENGKLYGGALKKFGINSEVHVFQAGGHGFGIRGASGESEMWPKLCGEWLRASGLLSKNKLIFSENGKYF